MQADRLLQWSEQNSLIIDGSAIANEIQHEIRESIRSIAKRSPGLSVVIVGENPASQIYVRKKTEACTAIGIRSDLHKLPDSVREEELLEVIRSLNSDPTIDGILVQLPLPPHISSSKVINCIDPSKDVDGFHPLNAGRLLLGERDGLYPCTPLGIQVLLERSGVELCGKHVLVIGRSNIVGKPIAALLVQKTSGGNATVTIAHSKTKNLNEISILADVIIAAMGKPCFLTADMVREGAVVIDVGVNRIENPQKKSGYELAGDVDFENVKEKCSLITPVPGGVGPMTIAMLLSNTWKSYRKRENL